MAKPDERFDVSNAICSVPNCGRKRYKREWCQTHYRRWRTLGDVQPDVPIKLQRPTVLRLDEAFRYWMPGNPPAEGIVWPWRGRLDRFGYGVFKFNVRILLAHRVSYEIFREPIPDGLVIRHKNDTPIDVNPWNMELGTRADNHADMVERGRKADIRGALSYRTDLTECDVLEIRQAYASGARQADLARQYGITPQTAWQIIHRKSWTHI